MNAHALIARLAVCSRSLQPTRHQVLVMAVEAHVLGCVPCMRDRRVEGLQ